MKTSATNEETLDGNIANVIKGTGKFDTRMSNAREKFNPVYQAKEILNQLPKSPLKDAVFIENNYTPTQ